LLNLELRVASSLCFCIAVLLYRKNSIVGLIENVIIMQAINKIDEAKNQADAWLKELNAMLEELKSMLCE